MRAAIFEAMGGPVAVVDDVDVREPAPDEVLVGVEYCGLCHSDVLMRDSPLAPGVLGHEAAGHVLAVGAGVRHVKPGDAVIATVAVACGRCDNCVSGHPTACRQGGFAADLPGGGSGFERNGKPLFRSVGVGGFAERVLMPAGAVVAVPRETSLEAACLLGCGVGTGLGAAINTAGVRPGDHVAVFGLGGVGLAAVQGARIAGAAEIVAVDPIEERRDAAARFGATVALAPAPDLSRQIKRMTAGGVAHSIETAGRQESFEVAVAALRVGGTVTLVGMPGLDRDAYTVEGLSSFILGEKRIVGSAYGSCQPQRDIPRFLALVESGRLDLAGMVTAVRPLDEVSLAFDDMESGRGIRTVLKITGS